MGFENCEVGFGKKMNWEMGLVPPSPFRTLLKVTFSVKMALLISYMCCLLLVGLLC
mgnify:CR=1 FL=1